MKIHIAARADRGGFEEKSLNPLEIDKTRRR